MDKRRVARIPSIFDSDDEEDDTSQNTGFSQEDNSDGEDHCKALVAGQSCVEESTSRVAREENEEMSDVEDENKSENDSNHGESKTSLKDNDGDDEQDALDTDEEQNSKNFEEVTDRGSALSYNVDDEEILEEEESEIVKDNDSSAVNEVEEEKEALDEDEDMEYRGDSNGVSDSNDNSDEFGEVEENENLVDEEFLSDDEINEKDEEDEEDFEEELVSAESNEVNKHNQEEGDDEMEDFDDLGDLNDAEDNTEDIEEGEETENEMEDDEGIVARMDENDIGVIRDDVTDEESLIGEVEEAAIVENEANDSLETSTSDKDIEETEEVCSNGELIEEVGSNDELVEEVGSNDELVEEGGSTKELVEVGSKDEGMDEKRSSTCEIADNCKVGDEAGTNSVDNDKEEECDNKDDSSVYEDGSDGYVIDLNGSEEESGQDGTKLEEREDIIDSSTSCSSVGSEGKSKFVKTKEVSQTNLEPDLTNQNDEMENSPKPPETMEVSSEFASDQTATKKNVLKDKVPETTVRRKIPLIRVPVRIEDIYTDSEDDSKKTPKDTKTSEIKDDTHQDDQKNIVSVTSQSESVDSESLSPDSAAQACSSKGERPRIWVSSSLFDKKNAPKSVDKTPTDVDPHATKAVRPHIRPQKSFNKEKCLFALKQGWRREMVHRATFDVNTPNRVRADIYYYTPEGKKLRSRVEIEDYLLRKGITDLTMDNFTFAKESVGGTDEQEQIRHAVKGTPGSTPRQKIDTNPNTTSPSLPAGETMKRGRPRKFAKGESPAKKIKIASTFKVPMIEKNENKSTTFRKATVLKGIEKSLYSNVVKVSSGPARPLTAIQPTPTWKSSPSTPKGSQGSKTEATTSTTVPRVHFINKNHVVFTTKLCNSVGLPIRILTPMLSERTRQQLFHCTGQCQLGAGTVPSLQCIKCLCLFHGQCTFMPAATVELIQSGGAKFLCPNCYKENKENADNLKYTPPTSHELLVQDPTSSESETGDEMNESPSTNLPKGYVRVNFKRKFSLPTPPSSPVHEVNGNLEDLGNKDEGKQTGVISSSFSSHSSTTSTLSYGQHHIASNPVLNPSVPNSQRPVLGVGPGGQIVQIPATSVGGPRLIFVRPPQTNSKVQHIPQVGPRAVYIPSIGGQVPLMLSGAGSSYSTPPTRYVNGSSNPPTSSQLYVNPGVEYSRPISSTITPVSMQEKQKTPPRSHPKAITSQKKNFFQELSMSYQLLLRVFKYLNAKDLLVTSCVCLMWRDLSYSSALWNTLRLRNICVRNWNLLAMFLERRNTRSIDLRKMVFRINSSIADQQECSKTDCSFDSPTYVQNTYSSKNKRHSEESYTTEDKDDLEGEDASHDNQPMDLSSSSSKRVVSPVKEASVSPGKTFSSNAEGEIVSSFAKQDSMVPIKGNSESPSVDFAGSSLENTELSTKEGLYSSAKATESSIENLSASCTKEGTGLITTADSDVTERKFVEETDKDNSKNQLTPNNKGDNPSGNSKLRSEENIINISSCSEEEPMEIDDLPIDNTEVNSKICRNNEVQVKVNGKQQVRVDKLLPYKSTPFASDCISERIRQKREGKIIVAAVTEDGNIATKKMEMDTWRHICEALGTVRCLRSVVLPPCMPEVLHLMLSNCKKVTSVTAADIISSSDVEFDPAYFMEAPRLKEIRIGSAQALSFTTNFNFIKLQELKVLVIKGYVGSCWPYLGTNLTSLHLGPCHNFTHQTWMNIGSMKNLRALWLEDGGSSTDNHIVEAINQLTQLRRLCLFNFVVGVKLGIALKKLTKLERLFVLQNSSGEENMGVKNHNMLAVTEHLRYVDELVWAVSSQDVKVINGVDHMHISSPKVKSYPSLSAKENASDQWPLKLIETVIKRHLPNTNVRIMKLDPATATRMALCTL